MRVIATRALSFGAVHESANGPGAGVGGTVPAHPEGYFSKPPVTEQFQESGRGNFAVNCKYPASARELARVTFRGARSRTFRPGAMLFLRPLGLSSDQPWAAPPHLGLKDTFLTVPGVG
jgi:hypothetical protein